MENMDKKEGEKCGGSCGCNSMGHMHGYHGKYHLVKVILKLFIVIIIFWCGFKLGEMTGVIRASYVRTGGMMMMHNSGGYNNMPAVTPAVPITPAQ